MYDDQDRIDLKVVLASLPCSGGRARWARRLRALSPVAKLAFGSLLAVVALVLIARFLVGCVQVSVAVPSSEASNPIAVCLDLPAEAHEAARKGVEWWGEHVEYRCPGRVTIRYEPTSDPLHCGSYNPATGVISWRCDAVRPIIAHEFGHALGYADSCDGVMRSEDPGVLSQKCNAGGTW